MCATHMLQEEEAVKRAEAKRKEKRRKKKTRQSKKATLAEVPIDVVPCAPSSVGGSSNEAPSPANLARLRLDLTAPPYHQPVQTRAQDVSARDTIKNTNYSNENVSSSPSRLTGPSDRWEMVGRAKERVRGAGPGAEEPLPSGAAAAQLSPRGRGSESCGGGKGGVGVGSGPKSTAKLQGSYEGR